MSEFDNFNDYVYTTNGGNIKSGGFSMTSLMMNKNISPMTTMNNNITGGSKFSDIFNNLAIPVGLTNIMGGFQKETHVVKNKDIDETTENGPDITNKPEIAKAKKSKKTKNNKQFIKKTKKMKK